MEKVLYGPTIFHISCRSLWNEAQMFEFVHVSCNWLQKVSYLFGFPLSRTPRSHGWQPKSHWWNQGLEIVFNDFWSFVVCLLHYLPSGQAIEPIIGQLSVVPLIPWLHSSMPVTFCVLNHIVQIQTHSENSTVFEGAATRELDWLRITHPLP